MTWCYQEKERMYIVNDTCMQIFYWNNISNSYEIKNMISFKTALHVYPDILKKYQHRHLSPSLETEIPLVEEFNRFHINRESEYKS
jgi:hypothetical protein